MDRLLTGEPYALPASTLPLLNAVPGYEVTATRVTDRGRTTLTFRVRGPGHRLRDRLPSLHRRAAADRLRSLGWPDAALAHFGGGGAPPAAQQPQPEHRSPL